MNNAVPAIEVEELQQRMQSPASPFLIDVRESNEFEVCAIPGAKLIPLGTLPQHVAELPKDQPIVVHCHHGGRSARAVAFLLGQGFTQVENLSGGIHAWAQRIDKTMKTY